MEQDKLFKPEKSGSLPRLNQCFLCKKWDLEEKLLPVWVPSQGIEYVQKLACKGCLGPILCEGRPVSSEGKET